MPKAAGPTAAPFSCRLSGDDRAWVLEQARRAGVDASQVIRWSIASLREHIARCGNRLVLPFEHDSKPR